MKPSIHFYVPGFPGEAIPRGPGEVRVVDIVSSVLEEKKENLEVIQYPGIFGNCEFSFNRTLSHTLDRIHEKIEEGFSVNLIGQSWGGLVSTLAINHYPINRLLLITPFVIEPKKHEIRELLNMYSVDYPMLVTKKEFDKNETDIKEMFNKLSFIKELTNVDLEVRVLVTNNDEIVPIERVKEFFQKSKIFKEHATLEVVAGDHEFSVDKSELRDWLRRNV